MFFQHFIIILYQQKQQYANEYIYIYIHIHTHTKYIRNVYTYIYPTLDSDIIILASY